MKRLISYISLFAALTAIPVFVSCSDSDDDNDNNGGSTESAKHIVRIVNAQIGGVGNGTDKTYSYDTQGRVVSVKGEEYYIGKVLNEETTYQYDQNSIQSHLQKGSYSVDHLYTLSNGLIVKDFEKTVTSGHVYTSTCTLKYDNNGYLTSITEEYDGEKFTKDVVWKNGDITNIGEAVYTYSDIKWNNNMIFDFGYNQDQNLFLHGYYGKLPQHMPLTNGSYYEKYEYTLEDGYINKIISKGGIDGDFELTYYWE